MRFLRHNFYCRVLQVDGQHEDKHCGDGALLRVTANCDNLFRGIMRAEKNWENIWFNLIIAVRFYYRPVNYDFIGGELGCIGQCWEFHIHQ